MSSPKLLQSTETGQQCVSIIGMAGCGKSTVGRQLAAYLGWAHLDTDHLIEAAYAARLQILTDALPRSEFLHIEDETIRSLRLCRTVISTGGSAVYSEGAMRHLQSLGSVVHLDVPLQVILDRIARKPERGLVIAPGQTVEDLAEEREALYRLWRSHMLRTSGHDPAAAVAKTMADLLGLQPGLAAPTAGGAPFDAPYPA